MCLPDTAKLRCNKSPPRGGLFIGRRIPTQALDAQHYGSTAIPDMPAKPIIDLLGGAPALASLFTTFVLSVANSPKTVGGCAGAKTVLPA